MEYVSQLYLPGAVALWCAVLFSLASVWGYSLVLRGDRTALGFARRAYGLFTFSIVVASLILAVLLLLRDYRIEYVYQYSGSDLPIHFQVAAFWAGQKGSFLVWLFWGAVLGVPLLLSAGRREASVMSLYVLTLLGLLFILVRESPFVMLPETPVDGAGLNPLLQDDWMVIHPPVMFIGYALAAVPFAFAMASLWRREHDGGWARRAYPWTLAGFLVLGAAILMGGYWAYKTLGWGGYWGWDPVENASLIPWLLSLALVHGLHMERARGRYRRANLVLAALLYLSVLYGTFLTRSGVLADFSVHSFVDLGISGWLVALMGTFFGISVFLLATRLREVPTRPNEDPLLSRGFFMVLATIVILVSAVLVTLGTSAPLLTRVLPNPAQVGPDWYNRVHLPLAIALALLVAIVPYLTWRGRPGREIARKLLWPGVASLGVAGFAFALGVRDPMHLPVVFLASLALLTNLFKTFERAQRRGVAAAGGWLSHVGVGIMLIGILASSAYDRSAKVTLVQNEPQAVDEELTLTFTRFIPRQGHEKERLEVKVERADGRVTWSYPKLFVNDRTGQTMANPDIEKRALLDLYVSPIDFDPGRPPGAARAFQLADGESESIGDLEVRFAGFDLAAGGDPQAAMASGGPVTVGADLEVVVDGETTALAPLYTFVPAGPQAGRVVAPPVELPGGGWLRVGGINAGDGRVRLEVVGVGSDTAGEPAVLSLDVTRKPLINLVWYGLYVILFGGLLAIFQRARDARRGTVLETAES